MNEQLIKRVKSSLNSQLYFMNESWLTGCIEFYITTHNSYTDKDILEFVQAQWQLSDLRDINSDNGCLPRNLSKDKCIKLTGKYILQVEKMYDISTPKYKQLEKIRNISSANVEVTEAENNFQTQSWEPKRKRMLQLFLTDGIQDVIAIEYKPMKLNDTLLPGYKIMIIGPVQCRRGVILLEEGKFKEIGGEVDTLLIPNALENVLARALKLPENPDPYNDNQESQNSQDKTDTQRTTNNEDERLLEDEFEINLDEIDNIERNSQELHTLRLNENSCTESISTSTTQSVAQTNVDRTVDSVRKKIQTETEENIVEFPEDDFDFNDSSTKNISIATKQSVAQTNINKAVDSVRKKVQTETKKDILEFPEDDFDFNDVDVIPIKLTNMEKSSEKENSLLLKNTLLHKKKRVNNCQPTTSMDSSVQASSSKSSEINNTKLHRNDIQSYVQAETATTRSGNKRPVISTTPTVSPQKIRCISGTSKENRKIPDLFKKPEPTPPEICTFICDIIGETINDTVFKTIRAKVSELGKLSKKDLCWQLEGTVTDGTGSLDVSFSNAMLEKLLGFTVQEFSQKKKLKKTNPEIEHELRTGCRNAEQTLKALDALLELELARDRKPKVINILQLTVEQKQAIDKRLKMLLI